MGENEDEPAYQWTEVSKEVLSPMTIENIIVCTIAIGVILAIVYSSYMLLTL